MLSKESLYRDLLYRVVTLPYSLPAPRRGQHRRGLAVSSVVSMLFTNRSSLLADRQGMKSTRVHGCYVSLTGYLPDTMAACMIGS